MLRRVLVRTRSVRLKDEAVRVEYRYLVHRLHMPTQVFIVHLKPVTIRSSHRSLNIIQMVSTSLDQ